MSGMSQQTNSDLVALERADSWEIGLILDRLLDRGEALSRVAAVVNHLFDIGKPISANHLARVIASTGSSLLYAKTKPVLYKDDWALVTLYSNRYPDPAIERTLCKRLYDIAADDASAIRRYIVKAIGEVGSTEVLPILEAILFNHAPNLKAKQVISEAVDAVGVSTPDALLRSAEVSSRSEFLMLIAKAIAAVKDRDSTPAYFANDKVQQVIEESQESRLSNVYFAQKQAERYLDTDPLTAMMHVRRGAEALAKDLYRILGHENRGKPAAKMMLEDLMKFVRESDVPELFKHCLQTCQLFGNFAAHDQDDQCKHLTPELAIPLVSIYGTAISIYMPWAAGKSPARGETNGDHFLTKWLQQRE